MNDVLLEMKPHTKAKHDILKNYLSAWFPILSKWNGRIAYFDGFAGPGKYDDGSLGSPIIALDVAKNHMLKLASEIVFYFIEKETKRSEYLQNLLNERYKYDKEDAYKMLPSNFKVHVEKGDFNEVMSLVLKSLEGEKANLAPSLVFVDPFGYSDINLQVLGRILSFKKCELLITYMVGFLNRFLFDEKHRVSIKDFLALSDEELTDITNIRDYEDREEEWLRLLSEKLVGILKKYNSDDQDVYYLSFKTKDNSNRTMYYLVYFTRNKKGVKAMKEAMWKIGKSYVFSDYGFNPNQKSLLDYSKDKPWIEQASYQLHKNFKNMEVGIDDIEDYITLNTQWIFRKSILKALEHNNLIEVSGIRKRKCTYPKSVKIKFL